MSHAEASAHCRAAGDLQFRGNALHGVRVVSCQAPPIPSQPMPNILSICTLSSMEGSDLCFEVVRRAVAGFVYSEAVAW